MCFRGQPNTQLAASRGSERSKGESRCTDFLSTKEQNYREVDDQLHQAQLLLEEMEKEGKEVEVVCEEQTTKEKEFLRSQAAQAKEA